MGVVKFVDFFVPLEETIDGQNGGSAPELDLPGRGHWRRAWPARRRTNRGRGSAHARRDVGAATGEDADLVEGGRLGGRPRMER